jgi:sugar lactone lactonase YvrE
LPGRHFVRTASVLLGFAAAGLLLLVSEAEPARIGIEPAALAVLESGNIVILDSTLGLFQFEPRSGRLLRMVDRFGPFEGIDMAAARVNGSESLFVTLVSRAPGGLPRMVRFNLQGKQTGLWNGWFSGIALDPKGQVAYLAGGQNPEIYSLNLKKPGSLAVRVTRIRDASTLGPIVFHPQQRLLYVGDAVRGVVYEVTPADRTVRALVTKMGGLDALCLDPVTNRLYVADASAERIWVVNLAEKAPKPKTFSSHQGIGEPLGLALGADRTLWVGDYEDGQLFQLAQDGAVLRTVDLARISPQRQP